MLASMVVAAVLTCPVEQAHYALRHQEGTTMSFLPIAANADWQAGIAAVIHVRESDRNYYFLPAPGGSNDQQYFARTTDVTQPGYALPSPDGGPGRLGDIVYLATDAGYDVIDHTPKLGGPAPAHILLPDLRQVTWYGRVDVRDGVVKQFFDLDGCTGQRG